MCKRKKLKAPLFGCGRSVSLIPGKDYIPSLMIVGAINLVLSPPLDPQNSALSGWTKGPVWSLVGKQKNPPNQTKTLLQLPLEISSEIIGMVTISQQENYLHQ